jgi:Putative Ig domain
MTSSRRNCRRPPQARPYSAPLQALDSDGATFFWQIVQGPTGMTITPSSSVDSAASGYANSATLNWTPTTRDRADTEVLVRVVDSRGGVALRRFAIVVAGADHVPTIDSIRNVTLAEGDTLRLPIAAADADGDAFTVTLRNVPAGARYDAATGLLTWTPSYDQAGNYPNVTVVASDGKHTVIERLAISVQQGYARPMLGAMPAQTLREGERFGIQLPGSMPGGFAQGAFTVHVLSGIATATPLGLNPYVTSLATQKTASTWGTQQPQQIIVSSSIITATGTLQYTAAASIVPRTWEEEEAAEKAQAGAMTQEWLDEMESTARAHWSQLVGG